MQIAIVGAGNMGKALARRWVAAGHSVSLSFSRDEAALEGWARGLGSRATVATPHDAVAGADVVTLSVPIDTLNLAISSIGIEHQPKPLISTVSPYTADFTGESVNLISRIGTHSAAEEIARRLPSFQIVEAFNLTFADLLSKATLPFDAPTVPLCGDHSGAKEIVGGLVRDAGLEPLDAGALRVSRTLEPMATAWVQLAAATGLFPLAGLTVRRAAPGSLPAS